MPSHAVLDWDHNVRCVHISTGMAPTHHELQHSCICTTQAEAGELYASNPTLWQTICKHPGMGRQN